jgi:hypothetical protein
MRTVRLVIVIGLLSAGPASAQDGAYSRVALDTSAAVETSMAESGDGATGVVTDAVATIALGAGFDAIVRPWIQKLGQSDEWNRQIWIATLRYQHTGRIGIRVDGGLIGSPVGYANLLLRPNINPTISLPSSLFVPLPSTGPGTPRTTLLGVLYPYGISTTVSAARWDVRAALIDTSPLRMRRVFAETNPPRFANVVLGGGVSPLIGLRVGASVTHGGWQRAGESPAVSRDLRATVVTVESEFAFRHTTIAAEFVRNTIQLSDGHSTPSGWFVQGQQTLSPRVFAAGRFERMTARGEAAGMEGTRHFTGAESVVGYRVTPELTVRAGHRVRRSFGAADFDHTASVSLAWWRRWR